VEISKEFDAFKRCYETLPRRNHALVPNVKDCNPSTLGSMLANIAIARHDGKYEMYLVFTGTEMERLSGTAAQKINYYDTMTEDLKHGTYFFHTTLTGTPCGAYVADIITIKSNQYTFATMQFPLCDDDGIIKYLVAYGYGRNAIDARQAREVSDHSTGNLRDLTFIDIGAGALDTKIVNFKLQA
jgi:hypothetical protein